MDGFEPNGSDLTNEFINTAKSIINSSKSPGEKSGALLSLFQSMTNYLNELDIDSRLKIVEQIILEEAEEMEEEKKELVQRVNEELQKMANEYRDELDEKHQQDMLKEIEKSAKPEEIKIKVDLAPEPEEINELDELEDKVDNFLARNKDGFRYTIENQQDIERINQFVKKFNELPDSKLARSGKKLAELRAQMARLREKFSQFQDVCDSINSEKQLSKIEQEQVRLETQLNSAPSEKSREELKKEIEANRLSREQMMLVRDVQQNLEERMGNFKAFILNRDFTQGLNAGPINESNFHSYEQELLKHFDVKNGEYISSGWSGSYRVETEQLQTQNLFSTKSLIETLQKEIPKALDETNESYIARVYAMLPESMNATAKGILELYNQVAEETNATEEEFASGGDTSQKVEDVAEESLTQTLAEQNKTQTAEESSLATAPTPQPPAPSSQSEKDIELAAQALRDAEAKRQAEVELKRQLEAKEQEKNQAKILPYQSTLANNLQSLQHPNLQSSVQPQSTSNQSQKNYEGPSTLESN